MAALLLFSGPAFSDPDKDESGKGRWRGEYRDMYRGSGRAYAGYGREYKEEFWDGNCKIERKWSRNGDYKEERKCKGYRD